MNRVFVGSVENFRQNYIPQKIFSYKKAKNLSRLVESKFCLAISRLSWWSLFFESIRFFDSIRLLLHSVPKQKVLLCSRCVHRVSRWERIFTHTDSDGHLRGSNSCNRCAKTDKIVKFNVGFFFYRRAGIPQLLALSVKVINVDSVLMAQIVSKVYWVRTPCFFYRPKSSLVVHLVDLDLMPIAQNLTKVCWIRQPILLLEELEFRRYLVYRTIRPTILELLPLAWSQFDFYREIVNRSVLSIDLPSTSQISRLTFLVQVCKSDFQAHCRNLPYALS